MSFSEFVRQRRESAGITQTEAAGRAGLSIAQWQKMEAGRSGRPTRRTVEGVAVALDIAVDVVRRVALGGSDPVEVVAADDVDLAAGPDLDDVLRKVQEAMDAMEQFKRAHERKERR